MINRSIKHLLPAIAISLFTSNAYGQKEEKHNFDITKNLDIFHSLVRETNMFYVDSIQPEKMIRKGIDAMLYSLDPYTNYIPESDMEDFKFMTTGEYGGIGSMIMARDGGVFISEPYEGMPALTYGLKAGDQILEIDGVSMKDKQVSDASNLLKGEANTKIIIKILPYGETTPKDIEVKRQKIQLSSIPYSGLIDEKKGYIQISQFTDKTGEEFKDAFLKLKNEKGIESLVIDLRENGGGIMEEAIKIVNFFTPRGKEVVSTRGKVKQWDRVYKTTLEPIDTIMPIAILVNKGSASASEILSGALQDMDRAVVMGQRTFGKGLVQTTRNLSYNTTLKVTTAKYYTPSGRCVQAINYAHRNADGSVGAIPDSLTNIFHTANGRTVRDGGGVTPDITLKATESPNILYYLMSDFIIFDYASIYRAKNPTIAPANSFEISDQEYKEFAEYVKSKNFTYDRQSEKVLTQLKDVAKFEGYFDEAKAEFDALEAKLQHNLDHSLETFKEEIKQFLGDEIVKRYYYQRGSAAFLLRFDPEVKSVIELLNEPNKYNETLAPPSEKASKDKI
ncbi:MAG: S41 family peptidase [Bacteroidales bacterium]